MQGFYIPRGGIMAQKEKLGGYMLIYRKMLNDPLWLSERFTKAQAWIDLLFLANYEDGYIVVGNGETIPVKRGQCAWSQSRLAKRWKWTRGKVEQYFKHLIEQGTIQRIEQGKIGRKTTIINILNYEKYQDRATKQATSQAQDQATNRALYKEIKKENKESSISEFSKKVLDPNYSPEVRYFLGTFKEICKKHTSIGQGERITLSKYISDLMAQEYDYKTIANTICQNFNKTSFTVNLGLNWLLKSESNFYGIFNGEFSNKKQNIEGVIENEYVN